MRFFTYISIIAIFLLILWIDLPRAIPIKFTLFEKKFDLSIRPLVISTTIGDAPFRKDFETKLGLDLRGGSHLVFEADTKNISSQDLEDALNAARDVIERRVNLFGISEPAVRTIKSGDIYRISVDLPGVNDVAQASSLIGQTAQLHFKTQSTKDEESKDPESTESAGIALFNLRQETGLTGKNVKKASVTFDQQTGQPQVALEFTKDGGTMFAEITKNNIQKQVGIFLDDIYSN